MAAAAARTGGLLAAKFAYRQDYHGPNGQGFRGTYSISRLSA
jgi:hypothetical protein